MADHHLTGIIRTEIEIETIRTGTIIRETANHHLTGIIRTEMERIIIEISIITEIEIETIRTGTIIREMANSHLTGIIRIEIEKTTDLTEIPEEISMIVRTGIETEIIRTGIITR